MLLYEFDDGGLGLAVSFKEIIEVCGIENFLEECPCYKDALYSKYNVDTKFVITKETALKLGFIMEKHLPMFK